MWSLYDVETRKYVYFNNKIDGMKAVFKDILDDYDIDLKSRLNINE